MPTVWSDSYFASIPPPMKLVILLAVIWSMVWKGIALWRAGRNGNLVWFIVMLIVNTLGILEIIYIFGFSQKKKET